MIKKVNKFSLIGSIIAALLVIIIAFIILTGSEKIISQEDLVKQLYFSGETRTTLGSIKKPAIIFQDDTGYFHAYSFNGERKDLGFKIVKNKEALRFDTSRIGYNQSHIFFDEYSDKVYFISGDLLVYDIENNKLNPIKLEIPIDNFNLAGVHSNYVVLRPKGGYAASTTFHIFNIDTGKLVQKVNSSQAEYYQIYEFENNGKYYRLHIDNKKGVKNLVGLMYNVPRQDLEVFLETLPKVEFSMNEIPEDHMEYVFSWGHRKTLQDKAIYKFNEGLNEDIFLRNLESKASPGFKYRVRSLYELENNQVGLEINAKLLVVDLKSREAETTSNSDEILKILSTAKPLAPPIENLFAYYYNVSNEYPFINVPKEVRAHFVSNLE